VVLYFFGSVGIKVSCVDMWFVGGELGVHSESIEEFLKLALIGEKIYASQVDCVVVERGRQRPGNRLVQSGRGSNIVTISPCAWRSAFITYDLVGYSAQLMHYDRKAHTIAREEC